MTDFKRARHALAATIVVLTALLAGCPYPQQTTDTGDDAGDGFSAAKLVTPSSNGKLSISGRIDATDDTDIFQIGVLAPGDRIVIDVRTTSGDLDPVAALFDANRNLVAFNDDRTPDASNTNPLIDIIIRGDEGVHYVGVAPFASGGGSGGYSLEVTITRDVGAPDPSGQIVYLNWAGGNGITVPNVVRNVDLPPFSASDVGLDAADTDVLKSRVEELLADRFAGLDITFVSSDDAPAPAAKHTVVQFGGFEPSAFAISEKIDTFNADNADSTIIFTRSFADAFRATPTLSGMATALANTIAHELGHLFGLVHTASCTDLMDTTCGNDSLLAAQAFQRAPLDDSVFSIGFQDSATILDWLLGMIP